MLLQKLGLIGLAWLALLSSTPALGQGLGASSPAPQLEYVFSVRVELAPAVEVGQVAEGRRRFIAITGGTVYGPRLTGRVLPGGGDWQTIYPGGLTQVEARYFLESSDGTVIEVTNPGVRTATEEIVERLTRGEDVDPTAYYFRTAPRFVTAEGSASWLSRSVFVARGIRRPDHVVIDFYLVS